jgi:hypothetical protein
MPKQNREYKKGKPFRDSRLFVIIAEGEREDAYFNYFNERNSRVRVLPIAREAGKSAPKFFVNRLNKAIDAGEYTPVDSDLIWFVCDTDRWGNQLNELKADCDTQRNWTLTVSNPCFEVWLHFHAGGVNQVKVSCGELKASLPQTLLGGFNTDVYCRQIEMALYHAETADENPDSDFPAPMQTKVYRLAKQLCQFLGNNWK